ncbi:hypothetical protein GCM10017687_90840 [Streptomyces echinatus]
MGLAALVAVFAASRRAGRLVVSGLLALSGAGSAAAALMTASDGSALDDKAAKVSGDTSATVHALGHTGWPYVAAVGGLLILLAGLLALRYGSLCPRCPAATSAAPRAPGARPAPPDPGAARGDLEGPRPGRGPDRRLSRRPSPRTGLPCPAGAQRNDVAHPDATPRPSRARVRDNELRASGSDSDGGPRNRTDTYDAYYDTYTATRSKSWRAAATVTPRQPGPVSPSPSSGSASRAPSW